MNSMAETTTVKSDQINAADLLGGPITVTIADVQIDMSQDQPVAMHLKETPKVFRPCKIMRRAIMEMWGNDAKDYVGRSMTLYCDPSVRFGKDQPGGTRISHMTHIAGDRVLTTMVSKGKFAPHRIRVLATDTKPPPQPTPSPATIAADAFTQDEARTVARRGTDAFRAWWAANPDKRADAKPIMDELKALCAAADSAVATDPFGLPPLNPTQSEIDTAMQAAERAAKDGGSDD